MSVVTFQVSFLKKEQVSSDVYKFHFRKPSSFSFIAGQYVKMKLDVKNPDSRGVTRYFTISSSPTEKDLFIITKIGKSTFKQALNSLMPGEKVQIRGPWGDLILPEKTNVPLVYITGGIGITPVRSILKYITDKKLQGDITVIASFKNEKEIIERDLFDKIMKENPKIRLIYTLTEPENSWQGETGRITTELLQKILDSQTQYVYYVSGPEKFASMMKKLLRQVHALEEKTIIEDFPGY